MLESLSHYHVIEFLFGGLVLWAVGSSVLGIRTVRTAYNALLANLQSVREQGIDAVRHPTLKQLFFDYEEAMRKRESRANPAVLVDRALMHLAPEGSTAGKSVQYYIRMIRNNTAICVGLGLLGTFSGLILALYGVSGALNRAVAQSGNASDVAALLTQLRTLISGMYAAFWASVFGVGGSVGLNLFTAKAGTFTQGDLVAGELEQYLANEYVAQLPRESSEDLQRQMVQRLDLMSERMENLAGQLEAGLSGGLGEAAREFGVAAKSMNQVLKSIEPVTKSLGKSGTSLSTMSDALATVTVDLKNVITAMQASQEQVPQRMLELQRVSEHLLKALGALPDQTAALNEGLTHFQASTRQLEVTVDGFRKDWPTMMQQFVSQTEQAVENQAVTVAESVERLRVILDAMRQENLEHLEQIVMAQGARVGG